MTCRELGHQELALSLLDRGCHGGPHFDGGACYQSGGRLRLGVGIGWNWVEYNALGENFRTWGRREEEQIGLLRRLWTEPVVEFTGEFDRVDRARATAGSADPALDRGAPVRPPSTAPPGWATVSSSAAA